MKTIIEWTPTSERLPRKSGTYLCNTAAGSIIDLDYSKKHKAFNVLDWYEDDSLKIEIKYWAELPNLEVDE